MFKKVLGCTVGATILLSSMAQSESGFYVGAGLGYNYASANNKMSGYADNIVNTRSQFNFGNRKLKDRGVTGQFFGGYEFEMPMMTVLAELSYGFDGTEAKYGEGRTPIEYHGVATRLGLSGDAIGAHAPKVTSIKLKRKHIFGLGLGLKKELNDKFAMMAGVRLLHSRFDLQLESTSGYQDEDTSIPKVTKRKSKYGIGPWVGASWNLGMLDAGVRYQYSRYQQFKTSTAFSPDTFSVNNKIRPQYHTFMVTLSKKF
jgi:hypothetical protein